MDRESYSDSVVIYVFHIVLLFTVYEQWYIIYGEKFEDTKDAIRRVVVSENKTFH